MSSAIMSLLISHILTFVESEIAKAEPEMVAALTKDIESLVSKLEALIAKKSPAVAAVTNTVLNGVEVVATAAVDAAGAAAVGNAA